jgi:hypothetical protein
MGLKSTSKLVRITAFALLAATACAEGSTSVGPLSIDAPKGWRVTSRGGDNLQLANGSTGEETGNRPGSAKAVFDIYLRSDTTVDEYRKSLLEQNVGSKRSDIKVDGYDATLLTYVGPAVGGRQEAVFVPRWDVRIVYRAAFANDDAAFFAGRSAFREALRSIRFSDVRAASISPLACLACP